MYARSMSGRADWAKVEDTIPFVRERMRPEITAIAGNLGLCLLLALQVRRFIVISGWQDESAMHASDPTVAPLRAEATALLGATTSVNEWEVAALRHQGRLRAGHWVSVAQLQRDPAKIGPATATFRKAVLPATDGLRGCHGAMLLVNRGTGRLANAVSFESYTTLHNALRNRAPIHDFADAGLGIEPGDITEYELDLADITMPESI